MSMPRSRIASTAAGLMLAGSGLGAAGQGHRLVPGQALKEAHGHLHPVVAEPLDLGQRAQPLPGEALGQHGQEIEDRGPAGEPVVGGVQKPLMVSVPKMPANSRAR
jgi:hypothetical protein